MRASISCFSAMALAAASCAVPLHARAEAASVCAARPANSSTRQAATKASKSDWVLDHYVRSASQGREWAVMVDCNHPGAPERMQLVPGWRPVKVTKPADGRNAIDTSSHSPEPVAPTAIIRAGSPVVVVNAPGAAMTMRLTGVAVDSAPVGSVIRVRLQAFHALIDGVVLAQGKVQLIAAVHSQWGRQ